MKKSLAHSVCPHDCASACALDVEILEKNEIGRLSGSEINPYTAGVICAKVARYAERIHHPDRLTRPLRRKTYKSATATPSDFEEISWDDALDITADSFERATKMLGPETIWLYNYAGTMGLVQRDGIQRLRATMGYSQQKNTICSWVMSTASSAGLGNRLSMDPLEFSESDLIIVWGANPVYTQINLMSHISKARKVRGAKLVVIDPYRSATAKIADTHISPKPGTDAALACSLMHVLFRDEYADRKYLDKYSDDPRGLEEHLKYRSPKWAAEITGVPEEDIESLAKLYGTTQRSIIRMGYGFSRSRNGAATLHAVSSLPVVKGAWKYEGGGLYSGTGGQFKIDNSLIIGPTSNARVLDMSQIGPILDNDSRYLKGGVPVTGIFVQSSNPAVVAPDSKRVRRGFLREDLFVAVHEQFMTETAQMADIIMPATTFLEHNDIYTSYGHTYLQLGPKVIDPIGESRSNHEVICGLAKRLGAQHQGFDLTDWELLDLTLQKSGYPSAMALKESRLHNTGCDFEESHFLNGFPQADGKFHFRAKWKRCDGSDTPLSDFPDFVDIIDNPTQEKPFRLITGPSRNFLNSSFTETKRSIHREHRPTAKIHPSDGQALGIKTNDIVRVGNSQGDIAIHAELTELIREGVIMIESVWPNASFIEGLGVNTLTSSDAAEPSGGAPFHDTAVWVRTRLNES
jgi:anaerobic selenocysteine-containing dehydrogenase